LALEAEACCSDLTLETQAETLQEEIANAKGQKRAKLIKRLR